MVNCLRRAYGDSKGGRAGRGDGKNDVECSRHGERHACDWFDLASTSANLRLPIFSRRC